MENKIKNIVCNGTNSSLIKENEEYMQQKMKEGWSIEVVYQSMIIALQNKLEEYNY